MLSSISSAVNKIRGTQTENPDAHDPYDAPAVTEDGLKYKRGQRNSVKRYMKRGVYDYGQIHTLVNSTPILHVSFSPDPEDPFPAILPMIGQMGSFTEPDAPVTAPMDCYLHGYVSSRIMKLAQSSESEAGAGDESQGLPVCIAASKIDGLVLSLTPNSHSYNYRSAVLFGHATIVTDEAEKLWAMELMTDSVVPGRWQNSRVPPNKTEMTSTNVLRVRIAEASCKVRAGAPSDEKADMNDESVTSRVWTGVVPVWETYGEPIPAKENKVASVPAYIRDFVNRVTRGNERRAKQATSLI